VSNFVLNDDLQVIRCRQLVLHLLWLGISKRASAVTVAASAVEAAEFAESSSIAASGDMDPGTGVTASSVL
jgi:hypothetical protein